MTDREQLADRLVRQKAILDLLTKANDETRAEAKRLYRPGSADATAAGRVSMEGPHSGPRHRPWRAGRLAESAQH